MSVGDVVLGDTQLMVLECAVDGPVMKLLVEYGPVITVFVLNNHRMRAFALDGLVMNIFQRETAVVVLLAENGPVMNEFLKETAEMMLPAKNGPEMIDL